VDLCAGRYRFSLAGKKRGTVFNTVPLFASSPHSLPLDGGGFGWG
jgi:hypothetical protein